LSGDSQKERQHGGWEQAALVHGGREPSGTRIQSVARAARLLLGIAAEQRGATAKELALSQQLALPTTYHLLNTLVEQGMLTKNPQGGYDLGRSVAIIAQAYLGGREVPEELLAALRALARRTGETAYLAEWRGVGIRVIASIEGSQMLRITEIVSGPYSHAYARANGKVLLAFAAADVRAAYLEAEPLERLTEATICDPELLQKELDRIRDRGFAYDHEEYAAGVSCVAAPLRRGEDVAAALGLSVPADRFNERRAELTAALLEAASAPLAAT